MSDVTDRRRRQAEQKTVLGATVSRRRRVSPSFARITLAGEGLRHLEDRGYDQWFRLFLPNAEEGGLTLPTTPVDPEWYSRYRSAAAEARPVMRYVTVREYRRGPGEATELDVDVVIHGQPAASGPILQPGSQHVAEISAQPGAGTSEQPGSESGPQSGPKFGPQSGPLSSWAQTAVPGQRVALLDQGTIFRPEAVAAEVMLLGDETALPAIVGIARALVPRVRGRAFIEVPHADDVQSFAAPAGLEVSWLPREGAAPGAMALAALRGYLASDLPTRTNEAAPASKDEAATSTAGDPKGSAELPGTRDYPYLYAAGESSTIRTLNELLREAYDWPTDRFTTVIYWHDSGRVGRGQ